MLACNIFLAGWWYPSSISVLLLSIIFLILKLTLSSPSSFNSTLSVQTAFSPSESFFFLSSLANIFTPQLLLCKCSQLKAHYWNWQYYQHKLLGFVPIYFQDSIYKKKWRATMVLAYFIFLQTYNAPLREKGLCDPSLHEDFLKMCWSWINAKQNWLLIDK